MPSGITTTSTLSAALPSVIMAARVIRTVKGVMSQLVSKVNLGEGQGDTWQEFAVNTMTATAITETTVESNYQQFSGSLLAAKPSMVSIATLITDKVARNLAKVAFTQLGARSQEAVQRKKDIDGVTLFGGASTTLGGAGTTATSGLVAAAAAQIEGNSTEPGVPPIYAVLHKYQIKDFYDELVAGVGTYVVSAGPTAEVFGSGFKLPIAGVEVYADNNISVDTSDDAKGGVFAKEAILLVQGKSPWSVSERKENIGGGSTIVYVRDEYVYVERSAGNWLKAIYSDATAPTS